MEEHSLNTAKRLHVSEKAWAKLANHFAILLSDKDTGTMAILQVNNIQLYNLSCVRKRQNRIDFNLFSVETIFIRQRRQLLTYKDVPLSNIFKTVLMAVDP